jgi:hypothetical protein
MNSGSQKCGVQIWILYLVFAFSNPPDLFAWTMKGFWRHVLPWKVEDKHTNGQHTVVVDKNQSIFFNFYEITAEGPYIEKKSEWS